MTNLAPPSDDAVVCSAQALPRECRLAFDPQALLAATAKAS